MLLRDLFSNQCSLVLDELTGFLEDDSLHVTHFVSEDRFNLMNLLTSELFDQVLSLLFNISHCLFNLES